MFKKKLEEQASQTSWFFFTHSMTNIIIGHAGGLFIQLQKDKFYCNSFFMWFCINVLYSVTCILWMGFHQIYP